MAEAKGPMMEYSLATVMLALLLEMCKQHMERARWHQLKMTSEGQRWSDLHKLNNLLASILWGLIWHSEVNANVISALEGMYRSYTEMRVGTEI